MQSLHPIDAVIIAAYVLAASAVGVWVARKGSRDLDSYVLGGKRISWWVLGLSNASGMFDVSGTMWMVGLCFVYGVKSIWVPWLWPVFNQVFLMMYLSAWLRRSNVMTGAEWIRFRFGDGRSAQLAHLVVVAFALINVIGFLAYGFIGIGKFTATFIPYTLAADPEVNAKLFGLIAVTLTALYVVKGGMLSVVFTEVMQFGVMTLACVGVGVLAITSVAPEQIAAVTPDGWGDLWFGWRLDLDWSETLPAAGAKIDSDGWGLFGVFFMMMLTKGVLQSMAGPAPNYDMQRILATRNPREAALMSGFVNVVLLAPRYLLITGLTVLALVFCREDLLAMGGEADFERVLPLALQRCVPVGLFGLLVAALLAAFMSTYAATVNAAPAYVVNDLYKRYLRPDASDKTCVRLGYLVSALAVGIGVGVGFFVQSLNDIIQWIVASLYGGYTVANLLKWHWWRFNGSGYFWGMATGIVAAAITPSLFPESPPIYTFPFVMLLSTIGCVAGSLLTPPDDPEVLAEFYRRVQPWGWWGPVRRGLEAPASDRHPPAPNPNRNAGRDLTNVAVGIAWQTSLTCLATYAVLQDGFGMAASATVAVVTTVWLKFFWYDRLEPAE